MNLSSIAIFSIVLQAYVVAEVAFQNVFASLDLDSIEREPRALRGGSEIHVDSIESIRGNQCEEIMALNADNKIMCTEDCSDIYLVCTNGEITEMPMAEGTKCYRNGIVHTSEGHCVIQEKIITYFELMDACMNYPELEYCASTADASSPPYNGAVFDDGAWYFIDKVWFSYISTFSEINGKGWDVFINIRFGHDQEIGRSRSIIASMDYGTTEIYKWNQYDLVDGDEDGVHYNCKNSIPDEPITKLLSQFIKNPAIIFGLRHGEFEIPDDDETHNFTAQISIEASELGSDYEGNVDVLIESEDAENEDDTVAEPIVTPTFLFKKVIVFDEDIFNKDPNDIETNYGDSTNDEDDEEDDCELIPDDGSDMPPVESFDEISKLFDDYFNVTLNATVCSEGFEQTYNNKTDVLDPILNRGKLTAGTGERYYGFVGESIEDGTTEKSDQIPVDGLDDPISRRLMQLTKKSGQEKFLIPQDTINDCEDSQALAYYCCYEEIHFLACIPVTTNDDRLCLEGSVTSSRCVEANAAKDVILEPRFLKENIPMQLHTAEHLESLDHKLDDFLTEDNVSAIFDKSKRNLKWASYDSSKWEAQEEEQFVSEENFLPNTRGAINKWVSSTISTFGSPTGGDTKVESGDLWDSFGDLFLGGGGGLPNVKKLLANLTDLDESLSNLYNFNTNLERDMLTIYDLMQNIDMAEDELKNIDRTLYTLDHVLKLVSIIKYVKPITVPIRNAVSSARNSGIKKALIMVKKVRQSITGKYKPKIKKALTKNEQVRGVIAKSRFLNQNLMINPFNTTRNCKPSDHAAELLGNIVEYANFDTGGALDEIVEFQESMTKLVDELSGVIALANNMVDAIDETAKKADPIKKAMDPFYKALSTRITIPIWGPFCHRYIYISIPYPCGVRICKRCWRWFGRKSCVRYVCGIRRCYWRKRVRLPVFCTKRFSFTVNQVLNGISGVMDIIFWPINKAVDLLLKAIPMPTIPLLPAFPSNFDELEKMKAIGDVWDSPSFPTDLLDYPKIDMALPGLNDIVCGKGTNDLLVVHTMAQKGDITPSFIRKFYDNCDGMEDLNPVCVSTEELLCGSGECPTDSPTVPPTTDSPTYSPSISLSPTSSPTSQHSTLPSASSTNSPTVKLSALPSNLPASKTAASNSESPTQITDRITQKSNQEDGNDSTQEPTITRETDSPSSGSTSDEDFLSQ